MTQHKLPRDVSVPLTNNCSIEVCRHECQAASKLRTGCPRQSGEHHWWGKQLAAPVFRNWIVRSAAASVPTLDKSVWTASLAEGGRHSHQFGRNHAASGSWMEHSYWTCQEKLMSRQAEWRCVVDILKICCCGRWRKYVRRPKLNGLSAWCRRWKSKTSWFEVCLQSSSDCNGQRSREVRWFTTGLSCYDQFFLLVARWGDSTHCLSQVNCTPSSHTIQW